MKLFHKSLTPWISIVCALLITVSTVAMAQNSASPEYTSYYNPASGFKPAQTSLTQVFLQLAGSLEHHGSPEPYIRHLQTEHQRVSALYEQKTGKPHRGRMPAHMTTEYLDQFIANWNSLSPKLGLNQLAKDAGRFTREALRGKDNNGTFVIEILNLHQEEIVNTMKQQGENGTFEDLRSILATELRFNTQSTPKRTVISLLTDHEKSLSGPERKQYAALLQHERFSKAEFSTLDQFYKTAYDKLTEQGRAEMSKRIWAGTQGKPQHDTRNDGLKAAKTFQDEKTSLFEKIDAALSPEQASELKEVVDSFFLDLCELGHSEFEIGMLRWSLQ